MVHLSFRQVYSIELSNLNPKSLGSMSHKHMHMQQLTFERAISFVTTLLRFWAAASVQAVCDFPARWWGLVHGEKYGKSASFLSVVS